MLTHPVGGSDVLLTPSRRYRPRAGSRARGEPAASRGWSAHAGMDGDGMADLGTMTGDVGAARAPGSVEPERRIRRSRGLPGGRAVVGALLVTAAAVGVFAAFLTATAEPSTRYAVARGPIEAGTRIDSEAMAGELFDYVALDLPPAQASRAIRDAQAPQLVGRVVVAPIAADELLLASAVVEDHRVPATEAISFSLPAADAVGGALERGERIDVLATYGSGPDAWTAFVLRGVPLVAVGGADGGMGSSGEVTLTVAVSSLADVQALGHAVRTAEVFVTRSTVTEGDRARAPGPYSPSREHEPPAPDPAQDPISSSSPVPEEDPAEDGAQVDGDGDDEAGDDEADAGPGPGSEPDAEGEEG